MEFTTIYDLPSELHSLIVDQLRPFHRQSLSLVSKPWRGLAMSKIRHFICHDDFFERYIIDDAVFEGPYGCSEDEYPREPEIPELKIQKLTMRNVCRDADYLSLGRYFLQAQLMNQAISFKQWNLMLT